MALDYTFSLTLNAASLNYLRKPNVLCLMREHSILTASCFYRIFINSEMHDIKLVMLCIAQSVLFDDQLVHCTQFSNTII